jgi:hypothetical protein
MVERLARRLLVVTVVLAAPFGCGGNGERERDAGGTDPASTVATIGDTVTLNGSSFSVAKVETKKKLGEFFVPSEPNSTFVVVHLTITNRKNEAATLRQNNVQLLGGDGKRYGVDTGAALENFENSLPRYEAEDLQIEPNASADVVSVHDVPLAALQGAKLQVTDLFSPARGVIELGLA